MRMLGRTLTLAGVGLGIGLARNHLAGKHDQHEDPRRWLAVTVNRSPDEVGGRGQLPEPLTRLGDRIETRIDPAAGDKGTELRARPRAASANADDVREVRLALRHAKSIIETGEVLQPDARPSAHPGPAGKVLQLANRKSKGEGRL
jgi:hypothetical protein